MAIHSIICKSCGANEFSEQNGVYICKMCGTKHVLSDDGTTYNIYVDGMPMSMEDKYAAARNAYESCDYINALKFYKELQKDYPMQWEPNFFIKLLYLLCFNTNTDFSAQCKDFISGLPSVFAMLKENYDIIGRHTAMIALCTEFKTFCYRLNNVFNDRDSKLRIVKADMLSSREEIRVEIDAQCSRRYETIMMVNDFRNYILANFPEDGEIQSIAYSLLKYIADELAAYYADFFEVHPEIEQFFWQCFALLGDNDKNKIYNRYGIRDIHQSFQQNNSFHGESVEAVSVVEEFKKDNYAATKGLLLIFVIGMLIKGCS